MYAALAVLLTLPAWLSPGGRLIGAAGDPLMHVWQIAWPPYALTHGLSPFSTTWLNAPAGANLMWDVPPLPGILMWPVTGLVGPILSYNVLVVMSIATSGWCMFTAARVITRRVGAALVAGVLYAFSPFMQASASGGHTSLTLAFAPPLLLLLGYEAFVRREWSPTLVGVAGGSVLAAQYMTFPEGLAIAVIGTAIAVFWLLVLNWRHVDRALVARVATILLAGVVTAGVLASPAAYTMFFGPDRLSGTSVHGADYYVADLLSFVVPGPNEALSAGLSVADHFTGNAFEWSSYVGLPLLMVLLTTAIMLRRRRSMYVMLASLITVAILSLGPYLHVDGVSGAPMPWRLFQSLPFLSFLLPVRFSVLIFLWSAILVALLITETSSPHARVRYRSAMRFAVALGSVGVVLSWFPTLPFPSQSIETPPFFTSTAVQRMPEGATALVLPYDSTGADAQVEVWQALAQMRFRMPEGYVFSSTAGDNSVTGPTPTLLGASLVALEHGCSAKSIDPALPQDIRTGVRYWVALHCPVESLGSATVSAFRQQLRAWGVRTVLLGPTAMSADLISLMSRVVGAAPEYVGGVAVWWMLPQESSN